MDTFQQENMRLFLIKNMQLFYKTHGMELQTAIASV